MSSTRTLLILACLLGFQGCSSDPAETPPEVTVTVLQDGTPLKGMTDFLTQFGGVPGSPGPATLRFSARFDPVPQAADDEYVLFFTVTFPDGRVLAPGGVVDLSVATGQFDQNCFCLASPYAMTAGGTLAVQTVSDTQVTGALDGLFTLTDPLGAGSIDLRGRVYSLSAQSFSASPALPPPPGSAPINMSASASTNARTAE